jgi:hypothetical protein
MHQLPKLQRLPIAGVVEPEQVPEEIIVVMNAVPAGRVDQNAKSQSLIKKSSVSVA